MRKNTFEYSVPKLEGCAASPVLRSLFVQASGKLWGTFLFCSAPLQSFEVDNKNGNVVSLQSEGIEELLGADSLGVWAGGRSSPSGDTVLSVWHRSSLPAFLNFFGSDLRKADSASLGSLIRRDAGASTIRHSILEMRSGEWQLRRSKEAGVLSDVAIIGDYVFGLSPHAVFREPYLKTEKREVLRSDLQGNLMLARDAAGTFWFQAQNGRLQRMGTTDLKPKMTPLKVAGAELGATSASQIDGWMYALVSDNKQLVRIRINPVTLEEELQVVGSFEGRAGAIHVLDGENSGKLLVAESLPGQGSRLLCYGLERPEDPEMVGEPPAFEVLTSLDGIQNVAAMASSQQELEGETPRSLVWVASSPVPGDASGEPLKIVSLIDV